MTRLNRPLRKQGVLTKKTRSDVILALFLGAFFGFLFSYNAWQYLMTTQNAKVACRGTVGPLQPATRSVDFSAELTASKDLMLIGVMTAGHFLSTRAKTIHATWGNKLDFGKIIFFSGERQNTSANFTVVNLSGVEDGYPPQRKSFRMLEYIHDRYIDDFHWFVRADDDVYIRGDRLSELLRTTDSSEDILIGQAGVGKSNERGRLGLKDGDNFCLGGPGVVMSQSVLRKVGSYLGKCLNDTASAHEDVELGRCIRRYVGVICPWAVEAQHLFYQIFGRADSILSGSLDKKAITRTITTHPVKKASQMHRLHFKFLSLNAQGLIDRVTRLHQRQQRTQWLLRDSNRTEGFARAHFCGRIRRNSTIHWELFNLQYLYGLTESPVTYVSGCTLEAMKKVITGAICDINDQAQKVLKEPEDFKKLYTGSVRVHPTLGLQFAVDFGTLRKPSIPNVAEVPRHSRHYGNFQQSFAPLLAKSAQADNHVATVHFVVPLVNRLGTFTRFLYSFEKAFINHAKAVSLLIVYFPEVSSPERHKRVFEKFRAKHPSVSLRWSELVGDFSRARALELGSRSFGADALLFFADVDLIFTTDFHERCRANTSPGQRAYFPLMFSQFNPLVVNHNRSNLFKDGRGFDKRTGIWRKYSFGPACVYASDVSAVGGLNTTIRGWGVEDLDFYEKCLRSKLEVFRAPDPGLVHVYHPQTSCLDLRMNELQAKMCEDSRLQGLASADSLVEHMLAKGYL